jgi:hypothetical protein
MPDTRMRTGDPLSIPDWQLLGGKSGAIHYVTLPMSVKTPLVRVGPFQCAYAGSFSHMVNIDAGRFAGRFAVSEA